MRKVSIGKQDYESLIKSGCFYVDKTYFIKEWLCKTLANEKPRKSLYYEARKDRLE